MALAGNARSKYKDLSEPPWYRWREKDPAERAIRFIQLYCRSPKGVGWGKPLKLAEFQKDWIRRALAPGIRQAVMLAPRGTGKSTLLAALAVWATFDKCDSGQPQVYIMATTKDQANRSVFHVACKMVATEPELERRSLEHSGNNARIAVGYSGGECFPLTNGFSSLQGADPTLFVVDEIGEQTLYAWGAATMSSGKRPSSLVVGIGTPSMDKSKSALWHLRETFLNGQATNGFSYTEFSAPDDCDWRDEAMWRLANPAVAEGYLDLEAIRDDTMLGEALFRTFRLGQFVEGMECWLGVDGRKVWRKLIADTALIDGAETWAGVDIGLKRDTSAVVIGQWHDGKLHTTARIWVPTETQAVEVTAVMNHLRELSRKYNLVEVAYDPAYFDTEATELADEGLPMVQFPQSSERMVPACGDLYEAIMRQEISHDGDHAFERHVLNAMPIYPQDKGFRLTKSKSRGHIDACIALALMYARALRSKPLPTFACY